MAIFGITLSALQAYLLVAVIALILGAPISWSYSFRNPRYSKGFLLTLYALPVTVMTVLLMINNQVGNAIAIAGAFTLIRFRSVPGTAREIVNVFMSMVVGVALSATIRDEIALIVALIFTLIACLINIIFSLSATREHRRENKTLRITIPESLDYTGIFDDLFEKYTLRHSLARVKTTNMGSMFQLTYNIILKDANEERTFINELRCRNGNLDIICAKTVEDDKTL